MPNSKEIIKKLLSEGWIEVRQVGSHKQFKRNGDNNVVTVPYPKSDFKIGTLRSIYRQAG